MTDERPQDDPTDAQVAGLAERLGGHAVLEGEGGLDRHGETARGVQLCRLGEGVARPGHGPVGQVHPAAVSSKDRREASP